MHTHITRQNVKAAIRDDKAHMDYLKRDVKDDQKFHVADKDARQTADEKHITNLAQDVKYDESKGMSMKKQYQKRRAMTAAAAASMIPGVGTAVKAVKKAASAGAKMAKAGKKSAKKAAASMVPGVGSAVKMKKGAAGMVPGIGPAADIANTASESARQERKNLMKDNPVDKDASGKRK